jgi:hypothetical protein
MRVVFKIGNQCFDDMSLALTHGMPICWIREQELLSDTMLKTFLCLDVPDDWEPYLREITTPKPGLSRTRVLNFTNKVFDKITLFTPTDPIDCRNLTKQQLFTVIDKPLNYDVVDVNATTHGLKTIGVGGDFVNLGLFVADLGNLTGSLCAKIISDVTETAPISCGINLGAYVFKITSQALTKYNIKLNFGGATQAITFAFAAGSVGTFVFSCVTIKRIGAAVTAGYYDFLITADFAYTATLSTLLFHANGIAQNAMALSNAGSTSRFNLYNIIVDSYPGTAVYLAPANVLNAYENFTLIANGVALDNINVARSIKNWMFVSNTSNVARSTNSTSVNCATTSASVGCATNTNAKTLITVANELSSINVSNSFYAKSIKRGVCYDAGAPPAIPSHVTGYYHTTRPYRGKTSIGADQYRPPVRLHYPILTERKK